MISYPLFLSYYLFHETIAFYFLFPSKKANKENGPEQRNAATALGLIQVGKGLLFF